MCYSFLLAYFILIILSRHHNLICLIFTTKELNATSNGGLHNIDEYEAVIKQLRDENSSLKER
jgi:hypothetical protein